MYNILSLLSIIFGTLGMIMVLIAHGEYPIAIFCGIGIILGVIGLHDEKI